MKAALPSTTTPQVNEGRAPIRHGVIAYAAPDSEALRTAMNNAMDALYLPNLQKLLSRMACVSKLSTAPEGVSAFLMPHESAPQLLGAKPSFGKEAIMTPCHWQVGMNEVLLLNPAEMQLSAEESQQLLAAVKPYFEEDGLHLSYESPLVWRAKGQLLKDMPFASLAKVSGQPIKDWLPQGPNARTLQRLQSEMQMLLYQHPVNDLRSQHGRWAVNSFWVHRSLEQLYPDNSTTAFQLDLHQAAIHGNATEWLQQWQALDKRMGAIHLASPNSLASVTLCSETHWRHYRPQSKSWLQSLKRMVSPLKVQAELRALTAGVSVP